MIEPIDPPMTVAELRTLLAQYPDSMPVIYRLHSEYKAMVASDVHVLGAYDARGYWSTPYDDASKLKAKSCLAFPGN